MAVAGYDRGARWNVTVRADHRIHVLDLPSSRFSGETPNQLAQSTSIGNDRVTIVSSGLTDARRLARTKPTKGVTRT